ncbi:MAG: molybdopterin-dependent oxidoreductase, partial [Phycisphaerae bacterium]|nr:molybdopterin-dependent oxidoreductase [Phycisphaerae bacterium]MDW8263078.1 molybdopterin-dependent oxidoreductase [Phycisphaerales bacterium]
KQVMEYLLINHPLDCPVCDQAGECLLQDYSYEYGRAQSRFEEDKAKKPKKDVGEHVLLYADRCIMCTRCVRFTREISGTGELYVEGRGHREEIQIFPGKPLNNRLSGNVVDLCPVGALLDKNFLFKQRVWLLKRTPSISPVDAGGENIWLEWNEGVIYRIKPRFHPEVNQWWISDDTRYAYKAVHAENRLRQAMRREMGMLTACAFNDALETAHRELRRLAGQNGPGSLYAVLSPMMSCEEAFLLGTLIRSIDPEALLVVGPVPRQEDEVFRHYLDGRETFRIQGEKVPNRRGIERILRQLGGPQADWDSFRNGNRRFAGGWIVGGYLSDWLGAELPEPLRSGVRVVQDILPNVLTRNCEVLLPAAAWAEKSGCWENFQGRLQAFEAAIPPPEGAQVEGAVFHKLLGRTGRFSAEAVRAELGGDFAGVTLPTEENRTEPAFEFVEL